MNPSALVKTHVEKTAIPKFASFQPDTPSKIQGRETTVSENLNRLPKSSNDVLHEPLLSPKPHRRTLGRHHAREHHERSLKREATQYIELQSAGQVSRSGENIRKSFVVDRVGDPNNLSFGALHKYETASYVRFGAGKVVGSPVDQRIDRTVSTDRELVLLDDTYGLQKKRDKHAIWRLDHEGARDLKIKTRKEHDPNLDQAADYISLEAAQRAKRSRGRDGLPVDCVSSSDEDDTHYRSVKGIAKSEEEPVDQDLKYNSNSPSSQDIAGSSYLTLDELAQKQRVQLLRRIDAEPNNFEAWINLITHQDNMLGLGQDLERTNLTKAERRSNAEIKLSMFEKALEKVKDSEGREVLLLGMMQEATKIWTIDKILFCWKSILQQNRRSLRLWTKYLDFIQTDSTHFRFGEVQSVYLDCLNSTPRTRSSDEISVDELNRIFDIQIYVLLRLTLGMRESGFGEYATAVWQALLEFVFNKPVIVQTSDDNKDLNSYESMFEEFWDSEVPRIGEENAEGWASFFQKQGKPPQPRTEKADGLEDCKDHWKSWLASERRHNLLSRSPARTIDDIEDNDPYRVILFSDIRPFLISPPSCAGQQLILDAFMVFCCLPPFAAEGPESRSRVWGRDSFIRNDALRLNVKLQDLWKLHSPKQHGSSGKQVTFHKDDPLRSGAQNPFQFPVRDYQVSSDSLFAGKEWFSAFDTWQEQCFGDGGLVEVAWVLRSLKSLISVNAGEEVVALYVLALELRTSPETVRKTAKHFLRKRPFSIGLYNAYALIEYRLTDMKKGEGIIITSINMGKKLDEVSQRDSIMLWRTWIWETLSATSAQEALVRLLTIGDEEIQAPFLELPLSGDLNPAKPALLLRTERALIAIRDHTLSLSSYSHATFAIECLILFAYLRNAQSLTAAISAFKSNIAFLTTHVSSNSSNHEYLYQTFARLLHYHTTHTHLFKPSDIRSLLAESIAQFPQNTIFLSLYAWNEARFRIDDRVRSVVEELVLNASGYTKGKAHDSVIPHFFAIYSELHRGITFGSNVSTIRSTFERAIESDSGAHCAGLWKLYFLFEHSRSEAQRAKMVFWRGLKACPWAKDLYMLAFEHLRAEQAMSEADLRGIYELLGEKELRVHVGLEHIFEGLHERQADRRG